MDVQNQLKQIASLREQKGKEDETLKLIAQAEIQAQNAQDDDMLVKLNWERSLVFQHIAMNAEAQKNPDQTQIDDAVQKMEHATLEADKIIHAGNLTRLKPMSYRFLAQVYRYKKEYDKAAHAYQAAISEYEKTQAVNQLELKGFLAAVLVMQGKTQEGIDLALQTFDAFETDPKALDMKTNDYATWAIWKSGIVPRLVKALDEAKAVYDSKVISQYLDKSEDILVNPQGPITWGDSTFSFRKAEIKSARAILSVLSIVLLFALSLVT